MAEESRSFRSTALGAVVVVALSALLASLTAGLEQRDALPQREPPRAPRRLALHEFSWPRSSPAAEGLDAGVLDDYRAAIAGGEHGLIDSFLVIRHGALVHESYFRGWAAPVLHPCYSVTKSFTAVLLGQARARGLALELDDHLLGFFPEYTSIANLSSEKLAITLDDVLTMRAGLEWHELDRSYSDPSNSVALMSARRDWVKYVLDRPMVTAPGSSWEYNSGCTILLGGMLRNTSGRQPHELAVDWLFAPLDIRSWRWDRTGDGLSNCGWGLHLAPLDMAKLGELILRGGRWRGRQLVPEAWIETMVAEHATIEGSSYTYGYQCWRLPLDRGRPEGAEIVFAWGYGGQFVFVVPSLDLVVVSTASCYDESCSGAVSFIRPFLAAAIPTPEPG